ncbi:hypothetical protein CVT26_015998 [Gymnopilus dilepis]|uniref:Uncharacterized protein n=1 Tax=Gymnopilus dilepis TaxID=231916 RepID=A0A409YDK6_9AGAR|nr:hypothetical protein CVT26_015998 [Gymnopilus dilepis]
MSTIEAPSILNIHTPSSSFSIVHSCEPLAARSLLDPTWADVTRETLLDLYNKLSRKHNTDYYGERVGPGWLKYEYNDTFWNLDDGQPTASTSRSLLPNAAPNARPSTPTLHLRDPRKPLPPPPAYMNPAYYMFRPTRAHTPTVRRSPVSSNASTTRRSKKGKNKQEETDPVPVLIEQFEKFHAENGVRTVTGAIGQVQNVRMLLKAGYRHVYMSRKFAIKHGFIQPDAAPGSYGYGGLVNIGKYPITLKPSTPAIGTPVMLDVYLSEEPHFDVVLGRSFLEKRQVKLNSADPTDVVCLDTGEKIECELVILKDGRGKIVTVT